MRGSAALALAIVVLGAIALVVADSFELIDVSDGRSASIIALLAVGVWIAGGALGAYRGQGSAALTHAALWVAIALAIWLVYAWREPLQAAFGLS